ncbi:sensor histidine kinase [Corallococcus sp. RDP092CA]|uniref:sensor histidine kinase n=1 Tax=Corallococcus sp. RDP092CA TaxID=3109369 RepID=UPI0035AFBA3E
MSPPRVSLSAPGPGPDSQEPQGLLRKYRELLKKHTALVQKLGEHTRQQVITFRLSRWALETCDTALAVLSASSVLVANSRWHALGRMRGPWQREEDGAERVTLRDVGQAEAAAVLALSEGTLRVARYRQAREARPRVLEVRTERVTGHMQGQVLVLARDITEQARAEEELAIARATLLEQEKMRALGELAAGIAHDLGSTLSAMRLRLELFQGDVGLAGQARQHLDALMRIVADAEARVGRLQDFSRRKSGSAPERVQLVGVVRDAVDIVRGGIEHQSRQGGHPLRLDVELPEGLPDVAGSAMELRYVVINLLINARDAMPRGGTIRLRAFKAGRAVRLTVEDEGTGIPQEHLSNIFRPFFTTKGDRGTGLGLSMAHGVVTQAGGTLVAGNRPEGGAIFTLSFPALKPALTQPRASAR